MSQKTEPTEKRGTVANLETVAQNLKRHRINGTYYGVKKVGGNIKRHAFVTADRKTADRMLKEWWAKLDRVDPNATDLTVAGLVAKFAGLRVGMAASTVESERIMGESMKAHLGPATLVPRV